MLCWSSFSCSVLAAAAKKHSTIHIPNHHPFPVRWLHVGWIHHLFHQLFKLITNFSPNSKKHSSSHKLVDKRHAASRKCKTQFGRKTIQFVVENHANQLLKNIIMPSRKTKLHQKRPNSLANAKHAASVFWKHPKHFLSINFISSLFALTCKIRKATKITSFLDVIPPFCSKSRVLHKENIAVTKLQSPHEVV